MGFDAVKVDFCGGRQEYLNPKTAFAAVRDALLNNSSGRRLLLNLCNFIDKNNSWEFGPYTGNSWRTNGDISYIAGSSSWGDSSPGILANFDANAAHPGSNGPGHWNDPAWAGLPTTWLPPNWIELGIPGPLDVVWNPDLAVWGVWWADQFIPFVW